MSRIFGRIFLAVVFLLTAGQLTFAASGNKTMKLKDVALGKIVVVGDLKFVKINNNSFLSVNPFCENYSHLYKGCINDMLDFAYTGDEQTYTIPADGYYALEVWGAQGAGNAATEDGSRAGLGGYSHGVAYFTQGTTLHIFVGGKGSGNKGGYNGGSDGISTNGSSHGGGGMTHISLQSNPAIISWDPNTTLIAAGGGGGADNSVTWGGSDDGSGGFGGGLEGQGGFVRGVLQTDTGGTQIFGYAQGMGGPPDADSGVGAKDRGAGGGGWYGGISTNNGNGGGGGGSGWVYTKDNYDYWKNNGQDADTVNWTAGSDYYLTNAETIAGDQIFLAPSGEEELGHTGHGAACITQLSVYLGI